MNRLAAVSLQLVLGGFSVGGWVTAVGAAVPHPADEQIEQTVHEILARQEFTATEPWLTRILRAFFEWLGGLPSGPPLVFYTVLTVCIVLLILLLVHIGWTVRRMVFVSSRSVEEQAAARKQRLSAAYFEEAGRAAARQDFTEAVRCLFLSLVYRFDESGTVDFPHANTNREYLQLFTQREPLQHNLRIFVDALDDNWYGQQPMPRAEYDRCLALYHSLE